MPQPRILFVSYAHEDAPWLDRILKAFQEKADPELLKVWTDRDIGTSDDWLVSILQAARQSKVALLVVSRSFHDSDFIRLRELPELLNLYQQGRIQLTWVRVDGVDYRLTRYSEIQSVVAPEPPLENLPPTDQDLKLQELVDKLILLLQGQRVRLPLEGRQNQHKGWLACACIAATLAALWACDYFLAPWRPEPTEVLRLIHGSNWIGYEPANFLPDVTTNVPDAEIRRELQQLRAAGFTGIVTFGSRADLARIPAIAHDEGLAVIMGVWSPLDPEELERAYEQRQYVSAYCVGHNCLSDDRGLSLCTERDLERAVHWLRRSTRKPVTTTQLGKFYQADAARLNLMGDFLFPDLHHNYRYDDVQQDVEITTAEILRVSQIARQYSRPLMLKTLSFPARRSAQSPPDYDRQLEYFASVVGAARDPLSGPQIPVAFVAFSAFDSPWKRGGNFQSWDPFTGWFDSSGQERPVVQQWIWLRN
ncbi:MAG TPA: toll/interleukin-1 receptor domain-containing protein [Pirellulaceae bacterium]|nr:toll/interleukin-1 receptor domain-containing protein [Pirellulaceae bacterium]